MIAIKPVSILLVEDNNDHAELIIDTFEEMNLLNIIIYVQNGEAALAYLRNEEPNTSDKHTMPDLILMDIKMPRLNGLQTLKALKADSKLKHIPVVMCSTSSSNNEIQQCYKLGATSYITKPLVFEEFSEKIKALELEWVFTTNHPDKSDLR